MRSKRTAGQPRTAYALISGMKKWREKMETPQENKEEIIHDKDNSVLKKDMMICLVRTEQGPALLVNLYGRQEMLLAKAEIDAFLTMKLLQGDIKAEQMRQGIVKPGGIINAARRGLFR